jgi:hypothetical protein
VGGVSGEWLKRTLAALGTAKRAIVLNESNGTVSARVFPKNEKNDDGALARSVVELVTKEGWKIEELRTEEGRLDEVFRSKTLPDTVASHAARKPAGEAKEEKAE